MTLPEKDSRKGKVLSFNETTGNPEAVTPAEGGTIGTKGTPTTAPSDGDLIKFSTADDAWVYSQEIDAGTY
jgi:hypothetical protein